MHFYLQNNMNIHTRTTSLFLLLFMIVITAKAQDDVPWRENMKYLIYSPRYFGPNAFPLPEFRSGTLDNRLDVEVRGEYHTCTGDRTKDIYVRMYIPLAEGRAGVELSYICYEYYNMSQEMVKERHAAGRYWANGAHGDVVVSAFYKLFKDDKPVDLLFEASLKTASGNRTVDARYTDAATYWFDLHAGVYLTKNTHSSSFIRLEGLAGFYCWTTNDMAHRQDDAVLYAAGISGQYKNLTIHADMAGLYGYLNNGDRPLLLRTKLNYEYKKNILSFRYKHGIHDYLYDTYSVAYIRCF